MSLIELGEAGRVGWSSRCNAISARRRSLEVQNTENANPSFAAIRATIFCKESWFLNFVVIVVCLSFEVDPGKPKIQT